MLKTSGSLVNNNYLYNSHYNKNAEDQLLEIRQLMRTNLILDVEYLINLIAKVDTVPDTSEKSLHMVFLSKDNRPQKNNILALIIKKFPMFYSISDRSRKGLISILEKYKNANMDKQTEDEETISNFLVRLEQEYTNYIKPSEKIFFNKSFNKGVPQKLYGADVVLQHKL